MSADLDESIRVFITEFAEHVEFLIVFLFPAVLYRAGPRHGFAFFNINPKLTLTFAGEL
jgi:hypothetical protein